MQVKSIKIKIIRILLTTIITALKYHVSSYLLILFIGSQKNFVTQKIKTFLGQVFCKFNIFFYCLCRFYSFWEHYYRFLYKQHKDLSHALLILKVERVFLIQVVNLLIDVRSEKCVCFFYLLIFTMYDKVTILNLSKCFQSVLRMTTTYLFYVPSNLDDLDVTSKPFSIINQRFLIIDKDEQTQRCKICWLDSQLSWSCPIVIKGIFLVKLIITKTSGVFS